MPKITEQGPSISAEWNAPVPIDGGDTGNGGSETPQLPPRPLDTDLKRVWVAYAKALGADSKGTKPELIKRVG